MNFNLMKIFIFLYFISTKFRKNILNLFSKEANFRVLHYTGSAGFTGPNYTV